MMTSTRTAFREIVTEALLLSFSVGFLAWYVWEKIATWPWHPGMV